MLEYTDGTFYLNSFIKLNTKVIKSLYTLIIKF